VRARVENEAAAEGKPMVTLAEVQATQRRYLNHMESEMRGYQLDSCFGPSGCPNRALASEHLVQRIQELLDEADLLGFLKKTVRGKLRFHQELRIAVADCPNACSQPQIKDIGVIGACHPRITANECTGCGACEEACSEGAVIMDEDEGSAITAQCIACGKCVTACPTGTLAAGRTGYRVQLGGKLGRHPRLAVELPDIYDEEAVIAIIRDCIALYKSRSHDGRRLAELLTGDDIQAYVRHGRFPQADTVEGP
jgi:dissimilatory sulfite reductase (desulfoviridin) alpha/beta subunit